MSQRIRLQTKTRSAALDYRNAQASLDAARDRLYELIRLASRAGISYQEIGDAAGLSFQRVAQIVRTTRES